MIFHDKHKSSQFYPINDIKHSRQPETRAIMTWVKEGHFTASASLHGVTASSVLSSIAQQNVQNFDIRITEFC